MYAVAFAQIADHIHAASTNWNPTLVLDSSLTYRSSIAFACKLWLRNRDGCHSMQRVTIHKILCVGGVGCVIIMPILRFQELGQTKTKKKKQLQRPTNHALRFDYSTINSGDHTIHGNGAGLPKKREHTKVISRHCD